MSKVTPQISLVAYETRNPRKCFVKVPNQRGRWMLTDRCVVEVACEVCNAGVGEPCISQTTAGSHDYMVDTHYVRRQRWMHSRARWSICNIHDELSQSKPRIRTKPATIGATVE